MGFNIGVSADTDDFEANSECDKFIERTFYDWVVEYDDFGEQSCIIQTGKHFGLDLTPLTKLIYTNDEVDDKYIQAGLQKTLFLIELTTELIDNIKNEQLFIDNINYKVNTGPSDEERELMIKMTGHDPFPKSESTDRNPWRKYIVDAELLRHLEVLKENLECFRSKGQEDVFLTAG